MNTSAETFERLASPLGVVVREADYIQYGIYTDDELRKLSVVQVDSSNQRDAMNRPLPGGLYDPKMGPTDHYSMCPTCALDYTHCPGHLGRIELALPVYLPTLFPTLVQLLRGKCLHCHAFRMPREALRHLVDALALLDAGLLVDAAEVIHGSSSAGAKRDGGVSDEADVEMADAEEEDDDDESTIVPSYPGLSREGVDALRRAARADAPKPRATASSRSPHVLTLRRLATSKFYKQIMHQKKCKHCDRHSSGIKQEGGCKLFCVNLSKKKAADNAARVASRNPAGGAEDDDDDDDDEEAAAGTGASPAPGRRPTANADNDDDSDDDDDDDDDAAGTGAAARAPQKSAGTPAGGAAASPTDKSALESGNRFMTPSEALRHMELLYKQEGPLLRRLLRGLDAGAFFMRVVPVPPNRFRPPATLGDGVFEHSSNVILGRVLAHDIELRKRLAEGQGGSTADAAKATERVIRIWDELCRAVAMIPDSTKTSGRVEQEPPGVKQLIERKQGLFRMNMMGKRCVAPPPTSNTCPPRLTHAPPAHGSCTRELHTGVARHCKNAPDPYHAHAWLSR